MRPRIVLSAAIVGLAFAALLVWPRDQGPALRQDAPFREDEPPREGSRPQAAAEPDAPLPDAALPDEQDPDSDELELEPMPEPAEAEAPPGPEPESEPEAEVDPLLEPLVGAAGQPSRLLVRSALADAVARDGRGLDPSPEALDRAADAVLRMRAAQTELAELPLTPANAARRVALRRDLQGASHDFEKAMGLSPSDFTGGVETPGGVDTFDPEEPIPEPSYLDDPAPEGEG
jgi:hypothetical protein